MKIAVVNLVLYVMLTGFLFGQSIDLDIESIKIKIQNRIHLKDISPNERVNLLNHFSSQLQQSDIKMRLDSFVVYDSTLSDNSIRTLYFYDQKQRNTGFNLLVWDQAGKKWMGFLHGAYIYDAADRIIETQSGNWNPTTNSFDITYRNLHQFNSNGLLIKDSSYSYSSGVWMLDEKNDYTITNGKVSLVINSTHDGTDWQYYSKNEYTYDGNGNLIEDLEFYWDISGQNWIIDGRTRSSYNGSNKLMERIISNYNESTASFYNTSRILITYDVNGLKTMQLLEDWDDFNSIWINNELIELKYTTGKNLKEIIISQWNRSSSTWKQGSQTLAIYDESLKAKDLILPNVDILSLIFEIDAFEYGRPLFLILYEIKQANGQWKNRNKMTIHYSQQIVSEISTVIKSELNLLPNPAGDYLICNPPQAESYYYINSLDGSVHQSGLLLGGEIINVSNLPGGFYILSLRTYNEKLFKGKFLKI